MDRPGQLQYNRATIERNVGRKEEESEGKQVFLVLTEKLQSFERTASFVAKHRLNLKFREKRN